MKLPAVFVLRIVFFTAFLGTVAVSFITSTAMWAYDFSNFNSGTESRLFPKRIEGEDPLFSKHPYSIIKSKFPESSLPESNSGAQYIVAAQTHVPYMHECPANTKFTVSSGFVFPDDQLNLRYTTGWKDEDFKELYGPTEMDTDYILVKQSGYVTKLKQTAPMVVNTVPKPPAPRPDGPKGPHVVVVVIDALSRANLMRTMPAVRERMLKMNSSPDSKAEAVGFPSYHTVGFNTPPNEIPMFTGKPRAKRFTTGRRFFPDEEVTTPWVWQQLRGEGWVTSRASQWCREFMSCSLGLEHTDENFDYHYTGGSCDNTRSAPYADIRRTDTVCNNGKSDATRMVDWTTNVIAQADSVGRKSFNFMLFEQAHNGYALQAAATVQEAVMHLIDLVEKGDTILMLSSDHGLHYGFFSATAYGSIELRQPPLIMFMPKSWTKTHTAEMKAMRDNTKHTVSAFDMYETMLSLGGHPTDAASYKGPGRPLTAPIPTAGDSRTCEEAGIPDDWCLMSGPTTKLDHNGIQAMEVRNLAVEEINKSSAGHRDVCNEVIGGDIEWGMKRVGANATEYYEIMFRASPYRTKWTAYATRKEGKMVSVTVDHTSPYSRFERCVPHGVPNDRCICLYRPWAFIGY